MRAAARAVAEARAAASDAAREKAAAKAARRAEALAAAEEAGDNGTIDSEEEYDLEEENDEEEECDKIPKAPREYMLTAPGFCFVFPLLKQGEVFFCFTNNNASVESQQPAPRLRVRFH